MENQSNNDIMERAIHVKVGYLRKPCAESFLRKKLNAQGAENVICDTEDRETLSALLDSLNPGDTLYLWSLWHISMNAEKVQAFLQRLHGKGVLLYLHGKYIDFEDEQTQDELKALFNYHHEQQKDG